MKKLPLVLLVLACTMLVACNKGQEINGHTMKSAYKSVKGLKTAWRQRSGLSLKWHFGQYAIP